MHRTPGYTVQGTMHGFNPAQQGRVDFAAARQRSMHEPSTGHARGAGAARKDWERDY
ncbi:MAG TPA: hypothetical protein VJK50_03165 [Patescibacteria group bacterium]|nr:hypothetical protein [Patescibacteria group bacterium]